MYSVSQQPRQALGVPRCRIKPDEKSGLSTSPACETDVAAARNATVVIILIWAIADALQQAGDSKVR